MAGTETRTWDKAMVTLIAVYNSDGLVGRCNAKCYDAKHPECTCVCGGANHGGGLDQAKENTEQLAAHWIQEYAERKGLDDYEARVTEFGKQLSLF